MDAIDKNMASNWPLTVTTRAKWGGVSLHHWQGRPGQIPEFAFPYHQLNLALCGGMTTVRQTATGRNLTIHNSRDLCLLPGGQSISAELKSPYECLSLGLEPSFLSETAQQAEFAGTYEMVEAVQFTDPLLEQISLALLNEARSATPSGHLYAETLTRTLALHLLRRYTAKPMPEPAQGGGLPGYKLRRLKEFIREHLDTDLSLNELAAVVGLSPFHFTRAFKRATGQTPQRYLTQCRIERAKELLSQEEMSLVDVSASVGFKNQSHFTTVFHRLTGATPKFWRNAYSN